MDSNLRDEILQCSKKLFYQNGYKNTSIRQIANALNIHHPNIYYYFKSKKDIAFAVYGNIYQELRQKLTKCIPMRDVYFTGTYLRLHYKIFYWNKKLFTMYYDFTKENIVQEYVRPYAIQNYHLYLEAFDLAISDKELDTYFSIASAVEFRFVEALIKNTNAISFEEAVDLIIKTPLLYMGVQKEKIEDVLVQSFINANKVDFDVLEKIVDEFIPC